MQFFPSFARRPARPSPCLPARPRPFLEPSPPPLLALLLAAGLALGPPAARPGTLRPVSVADLETAADAVLCGTVAGVRPDPLGDIPATEVTLAVERVLKGAPCTVARFHVLGCDSGRRRCDVEGEARFRVGERVLVYLERNASSGRTWVMGGRQGRFDAPPTCSAPAAAPPRAWPRREPAPGGPPVGVAAADGPHVTSVTPPVVGSAADRPLLLVIRGQGFGTAPGRVNFCDWFGRLDGRVISWDDTSVAVEPPVPDTMLMVELTSGAVEVLDAAGRSSLDRDGCPNYSCRPASYLDVVYNYPLYLWAPESLPVAWSFNPAGLSAACAPDAVRRGFAGWNGLGVSRFAFAAGGLTEATPCAADGVNTVGALSPWPFSHAWVAATLPRAAYDPATGAAVIYECDTAFNADDFAFACDGRVGARQADLETIALHEAGHWLRLRHVNTDAEIMRVASFIGCRRPQLGPGDRAGAAHIYPSYGTARVVRARVPVCPAGDADSAVLEVTAFDREGAPRAGVPAESVWVELVEEGSGGATGAASSPAAARFTATAPTGADGVTHVALRSLSGPGLELNARAFVDGTALPGTVPCEASPLDLSGDGRVGPEDLTLARNLWAGRPAASWGPDTASIRAHLGHHAPGLPGGASRLAPPALAVSPTPFNEMCYVVCRVSEAGPAVVEVLDVAGARVRLLWEGWVPAGPQEWAWDGNRDGGRPAASGLYLVRVRAPGGTVVRKALRVR